MREENKALIEEYYRHPQGYSVMDNPTIVGHAGNPVCGDDIIVYVRIDDDIIVDYAFSGDISMHTQAASSFWYEFFIGASVDDVLEWTTEVIEKEGFILSTRRTKAGAIALLAIKNAIYDRRGDDTVIDFDDVLT